MLEQSTYLSHEWLCPGKAYHTLAGLLLEGQQGGIDIHMNCFLGFGDLISTHFSVGAGADLSTTCTWQAWAVAVLEVATACFALAILQGPGA